MPSVHPVTRLGKAMSDRRVRFRLALSTGFMVATVLVTGAALERSGHADDLFGSLNALLGMPAIQPSSSGAQVDASSPSVRRHAARRLNRERVEAASYHPVAARASGRRSDRREAGGTRLDGTGTPTRLGRQSMCVRLCDGFAFPVGAFHGDADRAPHEATCRSECPGAATALYVLPTGAGSMDEALDLHSGRLYSELPAAFHYSTLIDQSCSCHPAAGNRVAFLLHDFTLRRGDAVVTPRGVRVFHGAGHYPFRQADFVPLAHSRDIHAAALKSFHAIERASLSSMPRVASEPVTPSPAASVRSFEKVSMRDTPADPVAR